MHYIYVLECADGTLYAGYTTNVKRRVREHNEAKIGAKYTKSRRPVILRHTEGFRSVGKALKREAAIKRLSRAEKLTLLGKSKRKSRL